MNFIMREKYEKRVKSLSTNHFNEKIKKLSEKYGAERVANTLFNLLAKSCQAKDF